MGVIDISIKVVWGIIVGVIMVVIYKVLEGMLITWGLYNYVTIVLTGLVSYLVTYTIRDIITKAF